MKDHLKIFGPAIVLIILVAAGGAYALNKKQEVPSPTQTTKATQEQTATASSEITNFDQLVEEIANDATAETSEFETSADQAAITEASADDSIINSAASQTYEAKF